MSTVPFDLIATLTEHQPGTDQGVLHAVRLLRLLKLLRIARATRVLRRVQDQLDVHYGCARARRTRAGARGRLA